jgi:hypothetical protein
MQALEPVRVPQAEFLQLMRNPLFAREHAALRCKTRR